MSPADATGRLIAEVKPGLEGLGARGAEMVCDGSGVAETAASNALPPGAYRDAGGTLRMLGGLRIVEGPVVRRARPADEKPSMFATAVENEIANILTMKPGVQRFGVRLYTPQFEEELRASMAQGDQITEEDGEREREVKRLVWETKRELVERMDAGESLRDILDEAQREMQRLATYRRNLLLELDGILTKDDMSDEDVADYIRAANAILEDNGMQRISEEATFFRRKAMLDNFERRRRQ